MNNYERMAALAITFPTLVGAPGTQPFDAETLDAWAAGKVTGRGIKMPGSGAKAAAQFILSVWNHQAERAAGPFSAVHALGLWDAEHRAAFLAWASNPWWP
jgi:hypothetical protein